jgi:hypothetical protein
MMVFETPSGMEAQTKADDVKLLITNHTFIGMGRLESLDNYLSDLPYDGATFQFRNTGRRLLGADRTQSFIRSDLDFKIGSLKNQPSTATISFASLNIGAGMQYQLNTPIDIKCLLGWLWDGDFAVRRSSREVNNNINVDLSTNINLAATFKYDVTLFKFPLRILLDAKAPVFGMMFVPQRGASYYEIFILDNFKDVGHFSSFLSKNALNSQLIFQVPLQNLVLDLGIQSDYMKYRANNVFVKHNYLALQIGLCYDFNFFGGRKHSPLSTMLSTEW